MLNDAYCWWFVIAFSIITGGLKKVVRIYILYTFVMRNFKFFLKKFGFIFYKKINLFLKLRWKHGLAVRDCLVLPFKAFDHYHLLYFSHTFVCITSPPCASPRVSGPKSVPVQGSVVLSLCQSKSQ